MLQSRVLQPLRPVHVQGAIVTRRFYCWRVGFSYRNSLQSAIRQAGLYTIHRFHHGAGPHEAVHGESLRSQGNPAGIQTVFACVAGTTIVSRTDGPGMGGL